MFRKIIFLLIFVTELKSYSANPLSEYFEECEEYDYDGNCVGGEGGEKTESMGDLCVLSGELGGNGKWT